MATVLKGLLELPNWQRKVILLLLGVSNVELPCLPAPTLLPSLLGTTPCGPNIMGPSLPSGPWLHWANGESSRRRRQVGERGRAVTSLPALGRPSFWLASLRPSHTLAKAPSI